MLLFHCYHCSFLFVAASDILLRQSCAKILVGDPHQQIYAFRGARNALQEVQSTHTFYLTQVSPSPLAPAPHATRLSQYRAPSEQTNERTNESVMIHNWRSRQISAFTVIGMLHPVFGCCLFVFVFVFRSELWLSHFIFQTSYERFLFFVIQQTILKPPWQKSVFLHCTFFSRNQTARRKIAYRFGGRFIYYFFVFGAQVGLISEGYYIGIIMGYFSFSGSALDFRSGGLWFEPSLCRRVVSVDRKLYFALFFFTQVYKCVPAIIMLEGVGGGG